ncbi:MAG: tetratricopeptide repeat protein [Deltaproteobacteria bacterium]|nr:tetratricopeptide repeat protein [Deltaproteobacteria bacterium]
MVNMDNDREKKKGNDRPEDAPRSEEEKKVESIIELAKFYYLNKKYKEALEQFEMCLSLDPDNEEILLSIALIHEVNNEVEDAKEVYHWILKKNPENKSAREKLNKLSGL